MLVVMPKMNGDKQPLMAKLCKN